MVGWVFFRADTLPSALAFLQAMVGLARRGADAVHAVLLPDAGAVARARRRRRSARRRSSPALARRLARRRVAGSGARSALDAAADRGADADLRRVASCRWRRAPTTRSSTSGSDAPLRRTPLLVVAVPACVISAAAGGEPGRRRRRRRGGREPRAGAVSRARRRRWAASRAYRRRRRRLVRGSLRLPRPAGPLVRREPLVLAHVSPSPSVLRGQDGWLFYADDGALDDFTNESLLTAGRARRAGATTIVRAQRLVPRARHRLPLHRRAGQARDLSGGFPDIGAPASADVADGSGAERAYPTPRPRARRAAGAARRPRRGERLYHLTDTHWNERGAFVAYQQIIEAVRAQDAAGAGRLAAQRLRSPSAHDVPGMDLARMMGLTHVLREDDLRLVPRRPRRGVVLEPAGARRPVPRPDASSPRSRARACRAR